MKAASSIINREMASDLPASLAADTAFIWDPFLSRRANLLFSIKPNYNQEGKPSYINFTFVTKFLAVSCLVATTNIALSF